MEGDIGGGLILAREILLPHDSLKTIKISSSIVARSVGAGSGGFSRLVRLRIHPMFRITHPMESFIEYTAIDGKRHELKPKMEFGEFSIEGSDRPNGKAGSNYHFFLSWLSVLFELSVLSVCYFDILLHPLHFFFLWSLLQALDSDFHEILCR